jgi:CheY-like chemotaxis protein
VAWTFHRTCVKLASLVAVQGDVKEPPAPPDDRRVVRQEGAREPRPREAIAPGVSSGSVPREPVWFHSPATRSSSLPPPVTSPKPPPPTELQVSLSRVRQAFRDVAAVVEGLGALRSLGGEEALIEMAMFAHSHEQTIERVWKALAECEDAAKRAPSVSLMPSAPANERVGPASERIGPLTTDPAPMALDALSPEGAVEEEGPVTQVDAPHTRVLVVDDDPAVLRAFRRVLQGEHEIVTARDGSEALLVVLGGTRVDAIICDIGMPKLDGPAFFSELFELRPQLMPRVVFCTGGPPNEKTQRFLERLQAPLLFKPVAAADLVRAIDLVRSR